MEISYDQFIRTTDEDHEKRIEEIFVKLYEKGRYLPWSYEVTTVIPCESFGLTHGA